MNLRNLRYFVSVAETRSVSATAERLHRSQPAVSRAIQDLEADLGFALFLREGRRMLPTAEAAGLLAYAQTVLRDAEGLGERARQLASGKVSVLRVGGVASTVESVLPRLLAAFKRDHPEVEVALTVDSGSGLLAALEQGELDVIATREVNIEHLATKRLFPMHIVAVLRSGHTLASRRGIRVEDLAQEGLTVAPAPFSSRMLFDAACRRAGARPRYVLESPYQRALVALAEVDHGIAILPSTISLAGHEVQACPILSEGKSIGTWTSAVWDGRRHSDVVSSFVDIAALTLRKNYPGATLGFPVDF